MTPPAAACSGARALKVRGVGLAWDTYGPAPVRQFKPAEPPAVAGRAKGAGGSDTSAQPPRPRWPSHFGPVARPDFGPAQTGGHGPARWAGWLSPIGGVAQPDLPGGWPGGRRLSHPPDRAQTTTCAAPVPITPELRASRKEPEPSRRRRACARQQPMHSSKRRPCGCTSAHTVTRGQMVGTTAKRSRFSARRPCPIAARATLAICSLRHAWPRA